VGTEGSGLPAGAYRFLDRKLTIPMRPPVDSLNAAVATALLLYSPALARS
jgi:tRNA G18 (ribose-2'-O)-methylase SpoU